MRTKLTHLFLLYAILLSAAFQASALDYLNAGYPLINVYDREIQALNGPWKNIIDPLDNVITKDQVIKTKDRYTFFKGTLQQTPGPLIEYDWSLASELDVPGDWNTQKPELEFYEGTMWYQRNLNVNIKPDRRYFLYFEAANYRSHVFLNKELIGSHTGGYTPFAFDVTERLKQGENFLVAAVNNDRLEDAIPALASDWWNYGGITRPVHLVSVPKTYIHYYQLRLEENGNYIEGIVQLRGENAADHKVNIAISELGVDKAVSTNTEGIAKLRIPVTKIQRWSPKSPKLYSVTIKSRNDLTRDKIGFRTIRVSGSDILLNDKPVFLSGISIHEEPIGPKGGRKIDQEAARALLQEAKDLGANFVRLAHYPHSEITTRLADEMGLMVWSEVPIYWGIKFENPEMLALGESMLLENLHRDVNRASIVIWGVANETPVNEVRNNYLKTLIDSLRKNDPSRLLSAALMKDKSKQGSDAKQANTIYVNDPLSQYLDIVAVNEYEGWYGKRTLDEVPAIKWSINSNKPMIFSEFGAGALAGHHGDEDTRWTEEYQAKFYANTLKMADQIPTMRGMSPWILKDFRSPRRYHQKFQEFWNRKGIIGENGERKQAFTTLRDYYLQRADSQSDGN